MSLLLRLPRELRDIIYAYVVAVPYQTDIRTNPLRDPPYNDVWNYQKLGKLPIHPLSLQQIVSQISIVKLLPPICLTSRQLEQEATPLVIANTHFFITTPHDVAFLTAWLSSLPRGFESVRHLNMPLFGKDWGLPATDVTRDRMWAFILRCTHLDGLVLLLYRYNFGNWDPEVRLDLGMLRLEHLMGLKRLQRLVVRLPKGPLIGEFRAWLKDVYGRKRGGVDCRIEGPYGTIVRDPMELF
jgi:hypothetical protein